MPAPGADRNARGWMGLKALLQQGLGTRISLFLALAVILLAIFAPLIAPHDPNSIDLSVRLQPPGADHWAGTDELGRDLFSRILYGARLSLSVGLGIVTLGAVLGLLLGSFSGLMGGRTDMVLMRLVDIMMALPSMVLALALTAALGPGLLNAMLALGVLSVPAYTRVARGQALAVREREFVLASRSLGAGTWHQLRHHIVPNVLPALMVFMTFHLGGAILATSALSFIGLGAQPPMAEWGALIASGRSYVLDHWWYMFFPGVFIVVTATAFNLLGDGLRDLVDPRGAEQ